MHFLPFFFWCVIWSCGGLELIRFLKDLEGVKRVGSSVG